MQRDPDCPKHAGLESTSDSGKEMQNHHGLEALKTCRARFQQARFSRGCAHSKMDQGHHLCLDCRRWLYLVVVLDLYSHAIVEWTMSPRMTQHLVCNALMMALFRRRFPTGIIIHSDRGSQYCSQRHQQLIKNTGLCWSMGHQANGYDNADTERVFHTLKVKLVHRERYGTRRRVQSSIFEYIETYWNRQRRHSAKRHQVPMVFEPVT